jgi:hypothetical protein
LNKLLVDLMAEMMKTQIRMAQEMDNIIKEIYHLQITNKYIKGLFHRKTWL